MLSGPQNLYGVPPKSNIMLLPQLGAMPPLPGMSFSITNNAGWYDQIMFTQPNNQSAPLNLSGIDFHAELRVSVDDASNKLDMSSLSSPPQFIVGGNTGILFFSVDVSLIVNLKPTVYVMDIVAIDFVSGIKRNLCEGGPMMVTILEGVTR
jgi:hypothetical protein